MQQPSLFSDEPSQPAGLPFEKERARAAFLRAELQRHTVLYYRDAAPEISDQQFDQMLAELAALEKAHPQLRTPDSPTQRVGGVPSDGFEKVEHLLPMQSLENTYARGDLADFDAQVRSISGLDAVQYAVEAKIDGLAFCAIYQNGVLKTVATRGDGMTGDDITENARTIRTLPLRIPCTAEHLEVRGEIYMPIRGFQEIVAEQLRRGDDPFRNPRNAAAGSIKLLDPRQVAERPLDVLLYGLGFVRGLDRELSSHLEMTDFLREQGFPVQPKVWRCNGLEEVQAAITELQEMRHSFPFDMDGAVIKVNDRSLYKTLGSTAKAPRWARAFKYAPEQAETVLEAISVQVGRSGVLTPVAELRTVELCGSFISRATLHNEEDIRRKDIRIGDHVLIEKAGEVIPAIVAVIPEKRTGGELTFTMPERCPACGEAVQRTPGEVAVRCTNYACPAQRSERLRYFASRDALDIGGIGERVADALVAQGLVRTPLDLWSIPEALLSTLDLEPPANALSLTLTPTGQSTLTTDTAHKTDTVGGTAHTTGTAGDLFDLESPLPAASSHRMLGSANAKTILTALQEAKAKSLARWLCALGLPGIGRAIAREIASVHKDLEELAHSPVVADANRLYDLAEKRASLSPHSAANRAASISQRVAAAEAFEKVTAEYTTLGEDLIARGLGSRRKGSSPVYSCLVKPEAARTLKQFFASAAGQEFLAGMRSLGINPEGDARPRGEASAIPADSPFAGRTVVITGSFHELKRSHLTELLQKAGAKVTTSVSKSTSLLIAGSNPGADKTSAARQFGTPLMNEGELREKLSLPPAIEQDSLF